MLRHVQCVKFDSYVLEEENIVAMQTGCAKLNESKCIMAIPDEQIEEKAYSHEHSHNNSIASEQGTTVAEQVKLDNAANLDQDQDIRTNVDIDEEVVTEQESQATFDDLPNEIVINILSMISISERTRLEVVCSLWRHIILDIKDQKTLILMNRTLELNHDEYVWSFDNICYQCKHYPNKSMDRVNVSNSTDISSVLKRCPRLTALYICFEKFDYCQKQLAQDLNKFCPLLEHIQWRTYDLKTDFLNELGDFKNLSCWFVGISDTDTDSATSALNRQKKLALKSLAFGRGINHILSRTDPKCLVQIQAAYDAIGDGLTINRFHELKQLKCSFMSAQNYLHLATLTTLRSFTPGINEFVVLPYVQSMFEKIIRSNRQIESICLSSLYSDQLIPLIVKYLPDLKELRIELVNERWRAQIWLALLKLNKLRSLTHRDISTSKVDMDGLTMVLKSCSSLTSLKCHNRFLEFFNRDRQYEIKLMISNVVEKCQLNDRHHSVDYHFSPTFDVNQMTPHSLEWQCKDRMSAKPPY